MKSFSSVSQFAMKTSTVKDPFFVFSLNIFFSVSLLCYPNEKKKENDRRQNALHKQKTRREEEDEEN